LIFHRALPYEVHHIARISLPEDHLALTQLHYSNVRCDPIQQGGFDSLEEPIFGKLIERSGE
jgi:hypothetical protein